MKFTLTGRVLHAERPGGGVTRLRLKLDGKVDDVGANGRDVTGEIDLSICDRFANALGLGDKYTVTIVAEPAKE